MPRAYCAAAASVQAGMAARRVVAFVVILSAMASLATWGPWDKKLDPAAVRAMCQASEDAVRAGRRAERAFEDAAAASQRGGWDQSLTMVGERPSWRVGERERWRRLSAELIAASRKRTDTTDLVLGAASNLSEMRAEAVHLKDDASIIALDECGGGVDRLLEEVRGGRDPMTGAVVAGPAGSRGTTRVVPRAYGAAVPSVQAGMVMAVNPQLAGDILLPAQYFTSMTADVATQTTTGDKR